MSDFTRCSVEQAQLLERLIRSSVFTDDERKPILGSIARGTLSKERATVGIDWALREIKERKAALR